MEEIQHHLGCFYKPLVNHGEKIYCYLNWLAGFLPSNISNRSSLPASIFFTSTPSSLVSTTYSAGPLLPSRTTPITGNVSALPQSFNKQKQRMKVCFRCFFPVQAFFFSVPPAVGFLRCTTCTKKKTEKRQALKLSGSSMSLPTWRIIPVCKTHPHL